MAEPIRRTTFHANGQLACEWFILPDERQHGPSREWNAAGLLIQDGGFEFNQRHGHWRKWHDNGRLAFEARYISGMEDGTTSTWDSSGNLIESYMMVHGTGVAKNSGGWMGTKTEISYRDGEMHGPMTIFTGDGKKLVTQYHYRGRQVSKKKFEEATAAESSAKSMSDLLDDTVEVNFAASKFFRKRPPSKAQLEKAKQSDDALLSMLAAPTACEARAWLSNCVLDGNAGGAGSGGTRKIGGFYTIEEAAAEIERFYSAGAVRVTLVDILKTGDDEFARHLIIGLPEDSNSRSRLFARAAKWAEQEGFDAEKDIGQKLLFVGFD